MATKKGVPKGTNPVVQGAERRATMMALLSSKGEPQTLQQIMEATGWGNSGAQYTATKMVESGLIQTRKDKGKNLYFVGDPESPAEAEDAEVSTVKRKVRVTTAKEVELVVAGVLVILGRNPASGRLRIVLEEM